MSFNVMQHPVRTWFLVLFLLVLYCNSGCFVASALCSYPNGQYADVERIREDMKVGDKIRKLQVNGDNTEITLAVIPNDFVNFNPTTREVTVKKEMDADKGQVVSIKITFACTITASKQKIGIELMLSLIDVNEHPPVFGQSVYKLNIGELTPVGTTLLTTIQATDADVMNQNILYALKPSAQAPEWPLDKIKEYFSMPMPGKGILKLVKALDYEKFKTMSCLITATDHHQKDPGTSGPAHLTGTATLSVTIRDGDNRNPIFIGEPYTGKIPESAPKDTAVTMDRPIKAIDGDSGILAKIKYRISEVASMPSYFSVEQDTGILKLQRLGPPAGKNVVTVEAYQENSPKLRTHTARVVVTVQATNSVPPAFTKAAYEGKVLENAPTGTSVLQLQATDKDQGSILTYSLENTAVFNVDSKTGVISLATVLDYEKVQNYTFDAKVSDGKLSSKVKVVVNVLDVNDNDPVFSEPVYTFKYNKGDQGKVLGKVQVTDKDKNDHITLSLRDYKSLFSINELGEIRMIGKESDIRMSRYQLLVEAMDDGKPPRKTTGVVVVTFPPGMVSGAVVGAGGVGTSIDLIPIIVLACLCGLLLLVIIGLIIYVHKSKNRRTNKENNLMYYSNNSTMALNEEDGNTPIQANPLALTNQGYYNLENGVPGDNDPRYGSERQVSEIQLDTAVTPLGRRNGSIQSNDSSSSYGPHKTGMSTFKTNPLKGKKGKNKDRVEVYNAENAIERDSHHVDGDKPGITVYF